MTQNEFENKKTKAECLASVSFARLTEVDEIMTELLNENPTDSEITKKSTLIWHALEKMREFLNI